MRSDSPYIEPFPGNDPFNCKLVEAAYKAVGDQQDVEVSFKCPYCGKTATAIKYSKGGFLTRCTPCERFHHAMF